MRAQTFIRKSFADMEMRISIDKGMFIRSQYPLEVNKQAKEINHYGAVWKMFGI